MAGTYVASHTLNGTACYTGLSGTLHYGSFTSVVLTGANLNRATPKATLTDGAGNTVAVGFARPVDTLAIKFTPTSTTQALAAAAVDLPAIGSLVTIGGTTAGTLTGIPSYDGDWNYDGDATITPNPTGPVEISMTLSRKGALSGNNPTSLAAVTP